MATHSTNLAWKIPWREEPGRLQSCKESDTTEGLHFTKENRLINTENRPEIAKGERGCRREGMEVWD